MQKENLTLNKVFNEDSRNILDRIPEDIGITTTITSPPYFDMKDYGSSEQIGFGQSYENYLSDLQVVFQGVYEKTKSHGTLWIVIDSFKRNNQVVTLPFDFSDKLKEIGWLLQDIIIWKKDKTVPWSTNGFMQRKFEYILFFSKTTNYKSNKDDVRIYDTNHLKKWWVKYPERYNPKGKALDEVWEFPIPTQGSWGDKYIKHFCPLPEDMVATMIQLSSDEGDIVFDPFAGSGTVLSQSAYMNRNYLGFELNPDYVDMFEGYLDKTYEEKSREYLQHKYSKQEQSQFETDILNLRALKFARVLLTKIEKELGFKDFKVVVSIKGRSYLKHKLIQVEYNFVSALRESLVEKFLSETVNTPPLSKYGIEPSFAFSSDFNFTADKNYFGYTKNNTHSYVKDANLKDKKIRVLSELCIDLNENDYL